jgi:peptide/nickel transport system ATP-binding protein
MATNDQSHLVEVRGLRVSFGSTAHPVRAVEDVSFHVDRGETLCILGESGSGKSVSSMTIMGLVSSPPARISPHSVFYRGRDLGDVPLEERRRINGCRIAMIFQDPLAHLNPVYTIGWQIAEVFKVHPEVAGVSDVDARVVELLRRVGIPDPEGSARRYPHEFSGGQRQRIMIAMALALRPEVLIADEPTTALDVTVQAEVLSLVRKLQAEEGMALILITHDLMVAANMADRVIVMQAGKVVESGPVREIFTAPKHDYTRQLLAARLAHSEIAGDPVPDAECVLQVEGLSKTYFLTRGFVQKQKEVRAARGVSFDLHRGETVGIVGEYGSGKSTVARMLMRIGDPTGGTARFRGRDIFSMSGGEMEKLRRNMQMVFQDPYSSFNPSMRVEQILSEPWIIHKGIVEKRDFRARSLRLLIQVGLNESHLDRYPHEFSGGQRQRIAIARALALEPEVIICDEAVSALDVSVQAQVTALLRDLQKRLGLAYIFISHDLEVVRQIAHRVLVMKDGEVVESGLVEQIFDRPQHPYTQKLIAASMALPWEQASPSVH